MIAVFVGPTLSGGRAREILPDAWFCPPARCGDILALLALEDPPDVIALIDGSFEHTGAVWHKELLLAMSQGVTVAGASSMGALRSAELASAGMIPFGRIAAQYCSGELVDDDEVAVCHAPRDAGYVPVSDALVNIRATLERAVDAGIVDRSVADTLQQAQRGRFYRDRRLRDVAPPALGRWLDEGGAVDVKAQDAAALLEALAQGQIQSKRALDASDFGLTGSLRSLEAYVAIRPFPFDADWLPERERLGRLARLLGVDYILCRQIALCRALRDACGQAGDTGQSKTSADHLLTHYGLSGAPARTDALARRLAAQWSCVRHIRQAQEVLAAPSPETVAAYRAALLRDVGATSAAALDAWRAAHGLQAAEKFAEFINYSVEFGESLSPFALPAFGAFRVDTTRRWLVEIASELWELGSPEFWAHVRAYWSALHGSEKEVHARACDLSGSSEVDALIDAER